MKIDLVNYLAAFEVDDNDGGGGEGGGGDDAAAQAAADAAVAEAQRKAADDGEKMLSQTEVNKIVADEKRKYQQKYEQLEKSYENRLKDQAISDDERVALEKQLEDIQARNRTKEQQAAHERKQAEDAYKNQLEEATNKAKTWEQRYTESTIQRELQAAAISHDAYNPDQIVVQLRSQTSLVEQLGSDGKPTGQIVPMVEMSVKNEDSGATEKLQMTPEEAVAYMQKNPERWGNFFKNNIREGIGSNSATGGTFTGDGTVDVTKLSDKQYFELREKNPAALGLKAHK